MDRLHDHYQSYSWHQSHDQATVLLLLPYETVEEDVIVIVEENYLVAGVKDQSPIVKGQLYGKVDTIASLWQLEPRSSRLSTRERTTSTTSTASTQSSYAFVSDPEISSSFAASLEAGLISGSDAEDTIISSPALSSPISSSVDDHLGDNRHNHISISRVSVSPPARIPQGISISHASSFSSLESLHTGSGRLLTLHLEKAESVIWPSLIMGPVPESVYPPPAGVYPWLLDNALELQYNLDPTSLVLMALELYDIRKAKGDAFEYFIRAWHQARLPSAAIRLATHYLPLQTTVPDDDIELAAPSSPASSVGTTLPEPATPIVLHPLRSLLQSASPSLLVPGTAEYYLSRVGGAPGLAQLFLAAGLLYLEGTASALLASSYAGLSSLRSPFMMSGPPVSHIPATSGDDAQAWRKDREHAARFFVRARALYPALDVPLLPAETETEEEGSISGVESGSGPGSAGEIRRRERSPLSVPSQSAQARPGRWKRTNDGRAQKLEIPTIDIARTSAPDPLPVPLRRRPKHEYGYGGASEDDDADAELSGSMVESVHKEPDLGSDDDDRTWYLYLPGLVGAGTALLVVGLLSLQSWRKNQG